MKSILKQRHFWFLILSLATAAVLSARLFVPGRQLPVYGKVKDFKLTERSGASVSLQDLKGKIWIADFIFTRCAGICPMMSSRMRMIQEKFKNNPDIRLVSFSVDAGHDTPQVLSAYAAHFSADPQKWLFLTGDKQQIFRLSQQHFHLAVADIPEAEREAPDQSVDHSSKFVLVDREGNIRGYYNSEEPDFLEKMERDIRGLF